MKAIRIHSFGGRDALTFESLPTPQPGRGELLVKIRAASVNPVDAKIREGKYPEVKADKLPYTLGRDLSGTVEAVGPETDGFTVGMPIFAYIGIDRGAYADHAIVRVDEAVAKPRAIDHTEAAAVPLAAITAWQGLVDHGQLAAGKRVLVHGGAGGVGHFAIQFAKNAGAWVATTAAADDVDFVRSLGADLAIDYRAERFEEKVHDLDLVFDLIAGETQDRSWQVLREGGSLVSTLTPPSPEKAEALRLRAIRYTARPNAAQLADIAALIETGKVKVHVDRTFPLAEAGAAQDFPRSQHVRGKLVLTVSPCLARLQDGVS